MVYHFVRIGREIIIAPAKAFPKVVPIKKNYIVVHRQFWRKCRFFSYSFIWKCQENLNFFTMWTPDVYVFSFSFRWVCAFLGLLSFILFLPFIFKEVDVSLKERQYATECSKLMNAGKWCYLSLKLKNVNKNSRNWVNDLSKVKSFIMYNPNFSYFYLSFS